MAKLPVRNGVKLGKSFQVKDGKVVRGTQHLDVSAQIRQRKSKKVRVAKRGQ